ncbi:MAG: SLC13 family permease [Planctomycetaceae bacterium]|nr:MAG: SLC13 family permease [Planctomycetaceae bacterium]
MGQGEEAEAIPPVVRRWGGVLSLLASLAVGFSPSWEGLEPAGQRLAAVACLMAGCWMTQALPLEVTSLLPLVLFPWLGIASAKQVAAMYFNDSSFLYLGGFLLALALERWQLHRRLAYTLLRWLGIHPRRLVWSLMGATFCLSMWISNTATALMMLPLACALLDIWAEASPTIIPTAKPRHLTQAVLLGVGYAATLGGMATIIGTPTNLVYANAFRARFPEGPAISASQWMGIGLPTALTFTVVAAVVLTWRLPRYRAPRSGDLLTSSLPKTLELGTMSAGEKWTAGVFFLAVIGWVLRTDLQFTEHWIVPGWQHLAVWWLQSALQISAVQLEWINDSTVAMTVAVLLFVLPVRDQRHQGWQTLLDWQTAQRVPWGILLLFGGGFALSEACRETHLDVWLGELLAPRLANLPWWLIVLLLCWLITVLSELTSNVATASALLPIIAGLAITLKYDPRLFMLPAVFAASCGFMLPVSTPPHTIVFSTGRIPLHFMLSRGLILNLLGGVVLLAATRWLIIPQLGIDLAQLPDWAQ